MTWIKIPFIKKCYEVHNSGKVRSFNVNGMSGFRLLKGKHISPDNQRLQIDVKVVGLLKRKSILIHRLVFFCHYYVPKVLQKDITQATWEEFESMPLIVHVNGVVNDNRLKNLAAKLTHQEVALWAYEQFPERYVIPKRQSTIIGKDAAICTALLKKGVSYPQIIKQLSRPVTDMTIYRFNKAHGIDIGRSFPGLSVEQRERIPELLKTMNQKQIALHFGVSESCISRAIRGRKNR